MTGASTPTIAMMCESDALGGAEVVILRLSLALVERGYGVAGIGPDERTQPDRGSNGWLREKFAEAGLEWRTYRKHRAVDLGLPRRLADALRDVGAAAVHSHEFGMAVYGTAAARRLGLPHVISMHGNVRMTDRWTRRVALRWAFARSHATVAVSRQTCEHLESTLGLAPGRVTVIPNGVPAQPGDRAAGRRSLGVGDDRLVILAVGSLIPRKGHRLLLEALADVDRSGSLSRVPWLVAIAGTGRERAPLEETVARLGLPDKVRLLGAREDVPDLLAAADVFAMPSLWEGLPLALLEAMLAGKAIVASRIAGIPEAVVDEQEGLLVPSGDVAALAEALRRLVTEDALRDRLGRAAAARAKRDFTIDAMSDAYARLYGVHP